MTHLSSDSKFPLVVLQPQNVQSLGDKLNSEPQQD